ncbi:MAG: DEAD/DEAH box helicase [Actinobacteria bacterium]|nr:DEAD/DEAH box helicase [Actinomycetota bacterium]
MGTGKTIQSLSALAWSGDYPALVICPAVVKLNWARECLTWFPGRTVSVVYGKPGSATTATPTVSIGGTAIPVVTNDLGADIVVVNYDLVAAWQTRLGDVGWKAVIADEAHYLKTRTSARTKAIRALATGWDADQRKRTGTGIPTRYLLTGTPMLNRPMEVASLLVILGRLAEFGGYREFTARYCNPRWTRFGTDLTGSANLPELNTRLRLSCMIRRLKADVLSELPAKTRTIVDVEIDNAAEYRRAERDVAAWIGTQAAKDTTFLTTLDRDLDERFGAGITSKERSAARVQAIARQHVTAEARAARAEHLVRFSALKQLAAKGKLAAITEWVTLFLATGRKLVIFAHHREIVHALATAFACDAITGETEAQDRQDAVDRFQNDPLIRVLCGNIRAGGVGITLTAASDVLFAELDWNPGVHEQAEDRVNRIGQVNACTAWYFLAQATIDQDIHALIEAKRRIVIAGTDGDVVTGSQLVGMLASGVSRRVTSLKDRTR